jgi:hypothetical protein
MVFGENVKKATVGVSAKGGKYISVELAEPPIQLQDYLSLTMSIDSIHKSMDDVDLGSKDIMIKQWKREDGSVVRLFGIRGVPGLISTQISLSAHAK